MKHKSEDKAETSVETDSSEFAEPTEVASYGKKRVPVNAKSQTGGFSTHMRPDLARSAVIYLEQEDPKRRHREKVVCAVNVGDFELRYPASPREPEKMADDGRTVRRKMWDEAVHALLRIAGETGLNPKLVRNDKNSCRMVVQQDAVLSPEQMPDEFFRLELYYCSEFELERRKLEHVRKIHAFDDALASKKTALFSWKTPKGKKKSIEDEIHAIEVDKQFFVATTPDPREMDSGLIFKIELYTLKEYAVTKEKLKTIMGRYLEELSQIASANGTSVPASLRPAA